MKKVPSKFAILAICFLAFVLSRPVMASECVIENHWLTKFTEADPGELGWCWELEEMDITRFIESCYRYVAYKNYVPGTYEFNQFLASIFYESVRRTSNTDLGNYAFQILNRLPDNYAPRFRSLLFHLYRMLKPEEAVKYIQTIKPISAAKLIFCSSVYQQRRENSLLIKDPSDPQTALLASLDQYKWDCGDKKFLREIPLDQRISDLEETIRRQQYDLDNLKNSLMPQQENLEGNAPSVDHDPAGFVDMYWAFEDQREELNEKTFWDFLFSNRNPPVYW